MLSCVSRGFSGKKQSLLVCKVQYNQELAMSCRDRFNLLRQGRIPFAGRELVDEKLDFDWIKYFSG